MTHPVPATFCDLLDALEVPRNTVLYVQSSVDWIRRAGFDAPEVLATLREWVRPAGTLVMPVYPCRTTHLDYLRGRPVYNVRRTPTALGLLPELFRRAPDSCRSLDPDFCLSAAGGEAQGIVATDLCDPDPFGRGSTYERLLERGTTLVGLGVSLNTNSFIHAIDSRLQTSYWRPVYEDTYDVTVVDDAGNARLIRRRAISPDFQRLTQPSAVAMALDHQSHVSVTISGAVFFRSDLSRWARWSIEHAQSALAAGHRPCWLERL